MPARPQAGPARSESRRVAGGSHTASHLIQHRFVPHPKLLRVSSESFSHTAPPVGGGKGGSPGAKGRGDGKHAAARCPAPDAGQNRRQMVSLEAWPDRLSQTAAGRGGGGGWSEQVGKGEALALGWAASPVRLAQCSPGAVARVRTRIRANRDRDGPVQLTQSALAHGSRLAPGRPARAVAPLVIVGHGDSFSRPARAREGVRARVGACMRAWVLVRPKGGPSGRPGSPRRCTLAPSRRR